MSRLYEALKSARHSRKGGEHRPSDGPRDDWGIVIPPVHTDQDDPRSGEAPSGDAVAHRLTVGLEDRGHAVPSTRPHAAYTFSEMPELPAVDAEPIPAEDAEPMPADARGPAFSPALGIRVETRMSRRTRLLPHGVDPVVVEHYRKVRTRLLQCRDEKPFRTLLVTSANPQEGKTLTVLNLGLIFSMLPDFRVLVIDGDLRRGSLGNWLGVNKRQPGLSNLIDGSVTRVEDVVLTSTAVPVHFIVRGNVQATDMHASQLFPHFQKLREQFDLILVDSPPVNLITDVQLLAESSDAVLLVARAYKTTRQELEKAAQDLQRFRVIGSILNASTHGTSNYYYGYY